MKRIEFEGTTHEFPDDFTDDDISAALGGPAPTPTQPKMSGQELMAKGIVSSGLGTQTAGAAEDFERRANDPNAGSHVGSTLGLVGGQAVASKMGLGPFSSALARILGAGAGGAAGALVTGQSGTKGALSGAGPVAAMEVAAPLLGKVLRSSRLGAPAASKAHAEAFGKAAGEVAPTLRPGTTSQELQRTAEGRGLHRIGAGKEQTVQEMLRATGGRPLVIPSLGNRPVSLRAANDELSSIGDMMRGIKPIDPRYRDTDLKRAYARLKDEIREGLVQAELELGKGISATQRGMQARATQKALPPLSGPTAQPSSATGFEARPLTQREGIERTLEAAAPVQPQAEFLPSLTPSRSLSEPEVFTPRQMVGGPFREGAEHVAQTKRMIPSGRQAMVPPVEPALQLKAPINLPAPTHQGQASVAGGLWDTAQREYSAGRAVTGLLGNKNLFEQGDFQRRHLQEWLRSPANRASLARRLGGDLKTGTNLESYNKLVGSITGGAEVGMVDREAPKRLGLARAGLWGLPSELARMVLPNMGARYTGGQTPFSPRDVQVLMDLLGMNMTPQQQRTP